MIEWTEVCHESELGLGQWKVVEVDGTEIAVFNVEGEFYAIEDICTHDGACLVGDAIDGDQVICPRHGARFSIRTGEALTPPAYEAVDTFPVDIEDGMIRVRDDRWD